MANRIIYTSLYDAEIEYLESTGTQWIDTGIKASSNIGIYGTVNVTKNVIGCIFGARDGSTNINQLIFIAKGSVGESSYRFGTSEAMKQSGSFNFLNKVVTISNLQQHNEFKIDTYIYTAGIKTFTCRYNIFIYCMTEGWRQINILDGLRIYNFKIYNLDTLVRDFIPVRKGNIGYLYDRVSGRLFGNQGTGNFILGPDVNTPIERNVIYTDTNTRCVIATRDNTESEQNNNINDNTND